MPRTLTFTVATADLRAAFQAVTPHISDDPVLSALHRVRLIIGGDSNLYVMATNRYTVGLALASTWDPDREQTGERATVDLSPADVKSFMYEFKARKSAPDEPGDTVTITVTAADVTFKDTSGLFPDGAKSLTVPRTVTDDEFPDLLGLVAARLRSAGGYGVDEFTTHGPMLVAFGAAAAAYGEPLTVEAASDKRTVVLTCGESFVGLLSPRRDEDGDAEDRDASREGWLRRLPEPSGVDPAAEADAVSSGQLTVVPDPAG